MMGHKDGGKLAMDRYIQITERDARQRSRPPSVATFGLYGKFRKQERKHDPASPHSGAKLALSGPLGGLDVGVLLAPNRSAPV